jgi:GNAT superfamily N-acetyltransferase
LAVISVLNDAHRTGDFDCGETAQNDWLRNRALRNSQSDDTRTYVIADDALNVLGFYGIATGSVIRSILPGGLRRNAPDPVSCVLLVQLGVSIRHQGQGLSRELVLHAMGQAVKIASIAGCRLFCLHPARSDLVGFYQKFGFLEIDTSPAMMAMSMASVRGICAAIG